MLTFSCLPPLFFFWSRFTSLLTHLNITQTGGLLQCKDFFLISLLYCMWRTNSPTLIVSLLGKKKKIHYSNLSSFSPFSDKTSTIITAGSALPLHACYESHMPPCMAETQELPELHAVRGSPALWETLLNTLTPSYTGSGQHRLPTAPSPSPPTGLQALSIPPAHQRPAFAVRLLSDHYLLFASYLDHNDYFHDIKNINCANCTRAQYFSRWNAQHLENSFSLTAESRPWLLGSQIPLESWDAAWVTALFWLVDRLCLWRFIVYYYF